MNKVTGFVKDVVYGLPMALATLAAAFAVVKLISALVEKAAPGKGSAIVNAYSVK